MDESYRDTISRLIAESPFDIDTDVEVGGRLPTLASSEFLINKGQGDWAEEIVFNAINQHSTEYRALKYGRDDNLAAGDPGFPDFFAAYQEELNSIGKKPDLLVFRRSDLSDAGDYDLERPEFVQSAIAAIEVRSSSFLSDRYAAFIAQRTRQAEGECARLRGLILQEPYAAALQEKSPALYQLIEGAAADTFRELDFRARSWASSQTLTELSGYLKELKAQIKVLHRRDYLSITPKLEDIALVNRWIQQFGVPHYYLQVFFDKAYVIPFREILELTTNPANEEIAFSVERDVKNQGKTTIKVNVQVGREVLSRIDLPEHRSAMKELERGRLLFYVTFQGGRGYLDAEVFDREIANAVS